ncbi:flagellar M-ring protein FliF C-terminal domain-containing protein [Sphingomonas sp. MMS24-JH45]
MSPPRYRPTSTSTRRARPARASTRTAACARRRAIGPVTSIRRQQPGGIPGALSNTPPPASQLSTPQPATGNPGVPTPQPVAGGPAPDTQKQSDQFARSYDLGKEVSVTRAAPGGIKRLSVAVLLRDPERAAAPRWRSTRSATW